MPKPYFDDIAEVTIQNPNYRKVLYTDKYMQLVVMKLTPRQEIGFERHTATQFIRVERGRGEAVINGQIYELRDDVAIIVPSGAYHNVKNLSKTRPLKLYTIYSPPQHRPGTVQKIKPKND